MSLEIHKPNVTSKVQQKSSFFAYFCFFFERMKSNVDLTQGLFLKRNFKGFEFRVFLLVDKLLY